MPFLERTEVGAGFSEGRVVAGGFEIRYLEAGDGPPLVWLHGASGPTLTWSHELLAERYRVIAFETPGFGSSPVNDRSASLADLAETMRDAVAALGFDRCSLWGTSFGGKLALWVAVQDPDRLDALVLAAPAALGLGAAPMPPAEDLPALLYAHPERVAVAPPAPQVDARQRELVARLIGASSDAELEAQMRCLEVPTLVLFGSLDRITPPELGRRYRELLPRCHFVIVYDAAHAIDADRPEAFAAVVGDFLERRDEFIVRRESGLLYP